MFWCSEGAIPPGTSLGGAFSAGNHTPGRVLLMRLGSGANCLRLCWGAFSRQLPKAAVSFFNERKTRERVQSTRGLVFSAAINAPFWKGCLCNYSQFFAQRLHAQFGQIASAYVSQLFESVLFLQSRLPPGGEARRVLLTQNAFAKTKAALLPSPQ